MEGVGGGGDVLGTPIGKNNETTEKTLHPGATYYGGHLMEWKDLARGVLYGESKRKLSAVMDVSSPRENQEVSAGTEAREVEKPGIRSKVISRRPIY